MPHRSEEELLQEQPSRHQDHTAAEALDSSTSGQPRSGGGLPILNNALYDRALHDQAVRLPTFDLPVFSGDIAKFAEFWDVFDSAVHSNRTLPSTVKFHYLRTSLKDEALSMIAGYEITDDNYQLAINTLRETYFRPDFIRTQLSDRLQHLKPATTSAINQRITLAQVKSLWLQLKKLGDHDENIFVMRIIHLRGSGGFRTSENPTIACIGREICCTIFFKGFISYYV
ncbi:hypothetical protein TELCIR_22413 [Teladorsagia circumcincta]|uniref:Peptidase family A16 n=1 Tax=Teladorsagia circumcincta TaxID=45464 RepID=A0A2G9TF77_TELCI|nr:hypothetical protein TELCIR_22413 [Teladorsagia circumcincta]